jgi:hypothetical protein
VQKESQFVYQAGMWHSFNLWLKIHNTTSLYALKMNNSARSIKRIAAILIVNYPF